MTKISQLNISNSHRSDENRRRVGEHSIVSNTLLRVFRRHLQWSATLLDKSSQPDAPFHHILWPGLMAMKYTDIGHDVHPYMFNFNFKTCRLLGMIYKQNVTQLVRKIFVTDDNNNKFEKY